jgi:hypothetical protein
LGRVCARRDIRPDARCIRGHIARAALEAIAFQSADVLAAMEKDAGITLTELRVDGGATANDLLLQFQADILGVPVVRSRVRETTALGAAYLAGLAVGYWKSDADITSHWQADRRFEPAMPRAQGRSVARGMGKGSVPRDGLGPDMNIGQRPLADDCYGPRQRQVDRGESTPHRIGSPPRGRGRYSRGIGKYEQAVAASPSFMRSYLNLGNAPATAGPDTGSRRGARGCFAHRSVLRAMPFQSG